MNARNFFSEEEKRQIVAAIVRAEAQTTGEIRVHVTERCPDGVLNDAAVWFERLRMHETALRNGMLFFLAVKDHRFAIIGDTGINQLIDSSLWDDIRLKVEAAFREHRFAEGLIGGIDMAGEILKKHFPADGSNRNELPDNIYFG